jgi:hypothetical protein
MGWASGLVGTAVVSAQKGCRSSLPANRVSPLDGITRERIRISDIKLINLAYGLKPEERWADGDENSIIVKTESVIVEISTDAGLTGIGGCSRCRGP